MITDEIIKKEFIHQIVTRDIELIYTTQEKVIRTVFPGGTGNLADFLSRKPITISGEGLERTFYMRVFSYLRFLDIRYRKDRMETRLHLALYNRVIWGVLYNETMPDLRYGLTSEIRKKITAQLQAANPANLQP